MPHFYRNSWTTIAAAQLRQGDVLQNANSSTLMITSDVKVLAVKREHTRVIISTNAWHTIKSPDDGIVVKTPRLSYN
jgi:hypothetical protein